MDDPKLLAGSVYPTRVIQVSCKLRYWYPALFTRQKSPPRAKHKGIQRRGEDRICAR